MEFFMVILFWFIVGGGIGYAIGKPKGRETSGFIYGFLLGPFGWIAAAVAGPAEGFICPECGGKIHPNYKKCQNCGSDLQDKTGSE